MLQGWTPGCALAQVLYLYIEVQGLPDCHGFVLTQFWVWRSAGWWCICGDQIPRCGDHIACLHVLLNDLTDSCVFDGK